MSVAQAKRRDVVEAVVMRSIGARRRRAVLAACLGGLLVTMAACEPCDRDGCDAYSRPARARSIDQGITGILAYLTDVSRDGCQECSLAKGRLWLWTGTAANAEAAAETVRTQRPLTAIDIDRRYEKRLDVGTYLSCAGASIDTCAPFVVRPGEVTTVNVRQQKGSAFMAVFERGSSTPRSGWSLPRGLSIPAP